MQSGYAGRSSRVESRGGVRIRSGVRTRIAAMVRARHRVGVGVRIGISPWLVGGCRDRTRAGKLA